MSTTNGGPPAGTPTPAPPQAAAGPQLNVLAQYVKDFSFENPNAPRSLTLGQQQPTINIQINVTSKAMTDPDFEVELKLEGKAETPAGVLFQFDLIYAGVFRTQNIPKDQLQPLLLIECPRLLFPFAREIIASTVQAGGFPPLRIDPVDFVGLYRQRMAQQSQEPPAV